MSSNPGFRSSIISLWYRLITLGIVALVFSEALRLAAGKAQGWTYYLTVPEVVFELAVRLIAAALIGVALGTVCTAVLALLFAHSKSSREQLIEETTRVMVFLVVFLVSWYALEVLIYWTSDSSHRGPRFYFALRVGFFLVFAAVLCIPRARRHVATSLDDLLGPKMTRRTALATVIGTAALVTTEFALSKTLPIRNAVVVPQRPKSNFLLVTFDALAAEDMSLYGYRLPTTPNIDAFAQKGTVFTNFFSAATYTTPSIATIMTGIYPSESYVYHLVGYVRRADAAKSLPHTMGSAGYATGAFFSNPFAYYLAQTIENEYDLLPEPVFQQGWLQHLWDATRPLHQDSGVGSRFEEYFDLEKVWSSLTSTAHNLSFRFRPVPSFERAQEMLSKLPDGFFLWVHVMAPHDPYLPDPADHGRFLADSELRTFEEETGSRWRPNYAPDQQSQVNQRRLRYDEYIATADRAFGTFMSELEKSGKLTNTTVMVSADHGESFEGGIYQHRSPYLTRPVIHIPLIIRTPGQQDGGMVNVIADQTSLAPTILELAGVPKPDSMRGTSLVPWLTRHGQGDGEGVAYCQYLEKNIIFKPLRHGTVGVIDGRFQYVVYLDTQKGELRPLAEAQIWDLDRSAEFPERARALRDALHARFPDLVHKTT
jgi:arylsulfatase A-like enzyme